MVKVRHSSLPLSASPSVHRRSAELQILRLDDFARMVPFREDKNIRLLGSLIAARSILIGSGSFARRQTGSGGESCQDERAPCRIRTRTHAEFHACIFDGMCGAVIGFGHGAN
jgi:hypothetical protein